MIISKQISVIIVTYNSEKDIFDCLASIYRHNDIGDQLEIIIVDNNSPQFETLKMEIHQKYPDITIMQNIRNGGYGQGNNIGINIATAPVVAIVNPDVRFIMPIFQTILGVFQNDKIGIVGARQMQNKIKPATSFQFVPQASGFEKSIGLLLCNRIGLYCKWRMYIAGACFFVRKSLMDAIGGFDERIFLYGEENDIRYRILQFAPQTQIIYRSDLCYVHPTDHRPYSEITLLRMLTSNTYVLRKQGIPCRRYLRTEITKRRWNILVLLLLRKTSAILDVKKQIYLLKSKLRNT